MKPQRVLAQGKDFVLAGNSMGIFKFSLDGKILDSLKTRRRPTSLTATGNHVFLGELDGLEMHSVHLNDAGVKISEGRMSALRGLDDRFVAIGAIIKGLSIYDSKNGKLIPFEVADVVSIYSIESEWEKHRIWIGTDKGIFQLNFAEDSKGLVLTSFSKATGLASNKITNVCLMGSDIWPVRD